MKKILLLCAVAFTFIAADAQTKKTSKKAKKPSKESVANAKFQKQQQEKLAARTMYMDSLKVEDSIRLANDNLADLQKDSMRNAYREQGLKNIDSANKEYYLARMNQRNSWDKSAKANADVINSVNLSSYEAKEVTYINQEYNAKAHALLSGSDATQQVQQLAALNAERRDKIKAVVGKSKERKLERERKDYVKKNGADADSQWVDVAESVAVNR